MKNVYKIFYQAGQLWENGFIFASFKMHGMKIQTKSLLTVALNENSRPGSLVLPANKPKGGVFLL